MYFVLFTTQVACGVQEGTASSAPKAEPSNKSRAIEPWQKILIEKHNAVRSSEKARLQPLTWSAELATFAQAWADTLKGTKACAPAHRAPNRRDLAGKQTGENIYWQSQAYADDGSPAGGLPFRADGNKVAGAWAGEKPSWNFARRSCAPGAICGHYTQMTWKSTTIVGCGRASCGASEVWVCNYLPAGNFEGQNPF